MLLSPPFPYCSFGPPNDTVYSALFTLIQRQGIQERTVDVWGALQADGVRLSPHLFSSLFAGEGAGEQSQSWWHWCKQAAVLYVQPCLGQWSEMPCR